MRTELSSRTRDRVTDVEATAAIGKCALRSYMPMVSFLVLLAPITGYSAEITSNPWLGGDVPRLLSTLVVSLTLLTIFLLWQNQRHAKTKIDVQQQYTEITHAARLALVGEITGSITHEVTQPLSAILNNVETAEMLLKKPELNRTLMRDILSDVGKDALRAHEIVRKVKSLLQNRELKIEIVDINSTVTNVLSLIQSDTSRRHVEVRTHLDPEVPLVQADPFHLQQVLLNLIINGMDALEATPAGARRLDIRTAFVEHSVKVTVIDNGKGIEADNLSKIFEPFFTTKEQGMGLGLSIARSIVALHGGSIWAENTDSGGAAFCFRIPCTATSDVNAIAGIGINALDSSSYGPMPR